MSIESIDESKSSSSELACRTSPQITESLFEYFLDSITSTCPLGPVKFRLEGGILYVAPPAWSPQLRENIEQFLDYAENKEAADQAAKAKEALSNERNRRKSIEVAARTFGVPIK